MNEKAIWSFLIVRVGNAYGTAAIMGNLMAESALNPACATGKNKTENYVEDADAGRIIFTDDKVAFGLAQWCVASRKTKLWNYMKSVGVSVGSLTYQLGFLWKELSEDFPKTCEMMKNAKSIREASDQFMTRYEKPGDQSENMKRRRANYGQKFYDQFAKDSPAPDPAQAPDPEPTPKPTGKKMVVAKERVNIRAGDGKSFDKVGSLEKGQSAEWVATSNGFHGIRLRDRVGWVSADFSEVIS